ncbi:endonuclease MutS2 [Tenuifilum sp.]|uniref:endonuclease MutS2 n=1 Tax=Tenuifilum sp. TaxID=2760880 RepID=UPI002B883C17|nr:Smr/MutS family protein [Tenuifilum sp.]HOK86030.1 Smr/MutS family protein [Tenuifilum sp.]HON70920.1 Smr/MutS family protein [Tenuifilum sp.]HOU73773.1 Smr/MutS family protein [Tenuifilum sp.]HPP89607.1 Smr/MutS family protein [Tenuifilum sp.]
MIYPDTFEQKVGFDKVRELTLARCLCELGEQRVRDAGFNTNPDIVFEWIEQTHEMKTICQMEDGFPTDGYIDVTPALRKLNVEGQWLDENELQQLRRSLDTIKQLLAFVKRVSDKYPAIAKLATGINYYPYVIERIDSILDRYGRIKDNASAKLAEIRASIRAKEASVNKLVQGIMRSAREQGVVEADTQPTVREGRVVIPVAAANKRKLKGIVHDESATGKTVFIEPVEVVELNNEIRELEYEERREIVRILIELADSIRPYLPELLTAYDFMGEIDFIRAKALLAMEFDGVKPILNSNSTVIYLRQARHPILQLSLKREGKRIVPLDIELNLNDRILLISGPNAGGKSVCLKTVGLLQYMLQCGFLPCVLENSEMGIFSKIFIDIGDEQSLENDLSTYSSHLINMKQMLRHADGQSLVLIDEFGAGTEPTAGGAIAEAILQELCNKGTFGVITTHYSNLKHFAANTPGIVNGAMLFDNERIEPLFKLEIGKPGSSFAFEIARKIGLPEKVLDVASQKVGSDYITFEKHLREISRDKRYWEKKRESIRLANKRAEEAEEKLQKELEELEKKRKEIIATAKKEAQELLANVNKQIENTIRTIKETNADKERTREARKALENLKIEIENPETANALIERKMELIKQRQERKARKNQQKETITSKPVKEDEVRAIEPGDKVKVEGSDMVGEVISISDKSASVAIGGMITVVRVNKLKRLSTGEYREAAKQKPTLNTGFDVYKRRLNFKSDIDVRGYRAEEALEAVQDLIDDALMLGFNRVRILHGKGNGILKQVIRDFLKATPGVKNFSDEHVEFGGAGITVVDLDV